MWCGFRSFGEDKMTETQPGFHVCSCSSCLLKSKGCVPRLWWHNRDPECCFVKQDAHEINLQLWNICIVKKGVGKCKTKTLAFTKQRVRLAHLTYFPRMWQTPCTVVRLGASGVLPEFSAKKREKELRIFFFRSKRFLSWQRCAVSPWTSAKWGQNQTKRRPAKTDSKWAKENQLFKCPHDSTPLFFTLFGSHKNTTSPFLHWDQLEPGLCCVHTYFAMKKNTSSAFPLNQNTGVDG